MKNTFGDWKGVLFAGVIFAPFATHAQAGQDMNIKTQCKMAKAEVDEVGALFGSFMEPWLKGKQSELKIDRNEFTQSRVKNFNKQYAAIRSKYSERGRGGLANPRNLAGDISLRFQFIVNAFQMYAVDGDKTTLKSSWKLQHKEITDDFEVIKKLCAGSGR